MHGQTWPAISSTQSVALADDWKVFSYAALAVALVVWALILFAGLRFRRSRHNPAPRSQKESNAVLEIAWTIAPLLVVIALFIYTLRIESGVEALAAAPPVRVAVEGYRWGWSFRYQGGPVVSGTSDKPPEMVLPLGQTAELDLSSRDVVHAFWVPDMLFQRDATPGLVTAFDLTPSRTGTFLGRCAEFCGLNHALMTFSVRVVSPAEYRRWLTYEARQ